ncbi:MAG: SH3 domain-containing protein [Thermodesulfobacteriota bacterium]
MKVPVWLIKSRGWLLLMVLAALLCTPVLAGAETMKVSMGNQSLYAEPNYSGTPITPVPAGAEVNVVTTSGDWYKVEYQGNTGWMHRGAFAQAQSPQLNLPGMLFGGGVKQTKSDEVALAGKGFTPEVEAGYRQKHPEMNFALVDQVESFKVDSGKLQAFIKEGGLTP